MDDLTSITKISFEILLTHEIKDWHHCTTVSYFQFTHQGFMKSL